MQYVPLCIYFTKNFSRSDYILVSCPLGNLQATAKCMFHARGKKLSFIPLSIDLNMTENELKRVTNENRRLRDEAGASEKGIQESKEREIRQLNDKIRTIERDYDELLQKESREKIKCARAESEIVNLKNQIDSLEVQKATSRASADARNNQESSKFDVEIVR